MVLCIEKEKELQWLQDSRDIIEGVLISIRSESSSHFKNDQHLFEEQNKTN
jgi:hypothetical protein